MATGELPVGLTQLAHQLRTFRRVGSNFTDEFDHETILFIDFIATSTSEPPWASGFAYPPAWDIDRATLHQAVRNLLQLGRRMNQDVQEEFYTWRRDQPPMIPDQQPERPLGRVRPRSRSRSATSEPTNVLGQEQQAQEPPSDVPQEQPKHTSEVTSRPLETASQPEGVPGSFPEGTPVSQPTISQSAPPVFGPHSTQPYLPPPNLFDQLLVHRQLPTRSRGAVKRSLHRRSQSDLRPTVSPISEQLEPSHPSLEGPSLESLPADMGSRNELEPGSGPPNPPPSTSGPPTNSANPAGSTDLFGNLRSLLREELQGHAREAAERQSIFETTIRQDFERFQREIQRQVHSQNQNQHRTERRQQDIHMSGGIGGGNDYPPYGQENNEFYTGESERRRFSRDRRQPSIQGGNYGLRPSERRRMPPLPDGDYDDAGSELTEANLGRFHWKTEDVGYFHPDRTDDDGALTEERGAKTFYRDVYSFTDRIRDVALFKGELVVKVNIHSCLRGSALEWYTIELTQEEKKRLRDSSLEEGWLSALTARFKPRTAEAMNRLQEMSYGYKDVRAGRTPRAFAQEFLRNARSANVGDVYNQITMAWNKLEGGLRVHIPEPTPHTTVAEFLDQLDTKYGIWKDMTKDRDRKMKDPKTKARSQSRPQEPNSERRNPANLEPPRYRPNQTNYQASRWPVYQQAWTPWAPPSRPLQYPNPYITSNQATQGSQKIAGYFGNEQRDGQRFGQREPQNERRDTQQKQNNRKPWNQWKGPAQPQQTQQAYLVEGYPAPFPAYWSTPAPLAPPVPFDSVPPSFSGYYADTVEGSYEEGYVETESSDNEANQPDESDAGSELDGGEQALLAKAHLVAGTCHRCGKEFASRNALFDHLAGCQKEETAPTSNALLANVHDLPVIESETNCLPAADRLCRSWRYLTASIGIHSKLHMDKVCLDTGCTRTLIDEKTALDLHLEPQDADLIAVSGIGSLHESRKTVSFDAFIPGQVRGRLVLGKLPVTAYLVKNLPTKLLVGMNVMGPEGFEIDLWQRKGKIHACHELEFPFQIQSKPDRIRTVPVYAAGRFILPPHTRGRIPIRVKQELPRDRDFIFEPSNRTGYTMYAQLVDADFAWVEVENKTPRTVIIGRRSRLGYVSDADFAIAAEVDPEHAYLAASDPATRTLAAQTIDLRAERLATRNGRGTPDMTPNSPPPPEPPPKPDQTLLRMTKDVPATVLENGISIYGNTEQTQKLSDLISRYKIWGNSPKGNMASIPKDQWMSIPLVEGWEKRMPKPKVYRLGKKDRDLVDTTLDQLHEEGKVSWANGHTPSAYPVFVVWRKIVKDGKPVMKGRVVVDIRHLNSISEPDLYPVPSQEEILNMLRGKRFITVVDAKQCFHQWPVQPEHRRRLAVVSHRGQEVFNVAIMGYVNSVAFVQRQMDLTLHEFADFCRCYIDDIVIASATFDEHLCHLNQVFARLQSLNLSLDPKKSFIGYPSVQLLGQHVDAFGLTTDEEKIAAIQRLRFPETLRQLESYLGITGYLRHYIPKYASIIAPLSNRKTRLLKGAPRGGKERKDWSAKARFSEPTYQELAAYQKLQAEFARPRFLTHHDPNRQLYVDLDASAAGHGAMVYHVKPDYAHTDLTKPPARTAIQPVCFLSRNLTSAESRYWPTEMETSCLVWVVRKIRHMIEAAPKHMPVVIYSDHSATANISRQTSLDSVATEHLNLRLVRASQYLQQFNLQIYHRPGNTNLVADGLSRLPREDGKPKDGDLDLDKILDHCLFAQVSYCWLGASEVHLNTEFMKRIKKEYEDDTRCSAILRVLRDTKLRDAEEGSDKPHDIPYKLNNGLLFLLKDSGESWLVIPRGLNQEVFQMVHDNQGHCGLDTAVAKMQGLALYKGIQQLRKYIQTCPCRLSSIPHHKPYGYLNPIRTPDGPYQILTMDFMVSLPITNKGNDQILVAVDKFSKQIGLVPGSSEWDAERWGEELIMFMQTADWGLPIRIISDRDPRFVAGVWKGMFTALGVLWLYSTAWHPQTDGQTERSIQVVETMMRHQLVLEPKLQYNWERLLPSIQAALNSSKKTSTGLSPHELMYGQPLRQPWNLLRRVSDRTFALRQDAQEALAYAAIRMKEQYDRYHQPIHFEQGDKVLLRLHKGYNIPANKHLSRKLGQQFAGPFVVLQRVGKVAYKLDFPSKLKMHPVVSISQLEPFTEDPYGRWPDKPGPTFDEDFPEDEDRYEVERIVDRKVQFVGRKRKPVVKYLVRWKGYGSEDDWWLTKDQLEGAEELVDDYDNKHPL